MVNVTKVRPVAKYIHVLWKMCCGDGWPDLSRRVSWEIKYIDIMMFIKELEDEKLQQ